MTGLSSPSASYRHRMLAAVPAKARFISASFLVASHSSAADRPGQAASAMKRTR